MMWFMFDLTGLPESIHSSLTRTFIRSSRGEKSRSDSHFYAASQDHEAAPATYYLHVADELLYSGLIRQFGGRRCGPPPVAKLHEIEREGDSKVSAP